MSEPLKIPFIFVFILACTLLVCAALDTLSAWGLSDSAARGFTLAYAVRRLPLSTLNVAVPAVVLSIVLMGLRLARQETSRFVSLALVLGVGYTALVNVMLLVRPLAGPPTAPPSPRQYLPPSTFVRLGDRVVAARAVTDTEARAILIYDSQARASRLSVAPQALLQLRGGTLSITATGPQPVRLSGAPEPAWTGLFTPDRYTGLFLRDVGAMSADFQSLLVRSRAEFLLSCFALVFLCTASFMFLRLTRWPLLNVALLAAAVRGYFSLYHLIAQDFAPQLAQAVADPFVVRAAPALVFIALGALLLLVDILFLPSRRPEDAAGR